MSLVASPKNSLGEYSPSSGRHCSTCPGGLSPGLAAVGRSKVQVHFCFKMSLLLRQLQGQSHRQASSVCEPTVRYGEGYLQPRVLRVSQCGRKSWDWILILLCGEAL